MALSHSNSSSLEQLTLKGLSESVEMLDIQNIWKVAKWLLSVWFTVEMWASLWSGEINSKQFARH